MLYEVITYHFEAKSSGVGYRLITIVTPVRSTSNGIATFSEANRRNALPSERIIRRLLLCLRRGHLALELRHHVHEPPGLLLQFAFPVVHGVDLEHGGKIAFGELDVAELEGRDAERVADTGIGRCQRPCVFEALYVV